MATVAELNIYPIKSCAGFALKSAELTATGLAHDRQWMLVDQHGRYLTQREHAKLALVRTAIKFDNLIITAPGMLRLDLPIDVIEDAPETWRTVNIWDDQVKAVDEGDLCAQWFSDFLGTPARLVKFHPDAQRPCNPQWAGPTGATTMFADGYPILLIGRASLEDLNRRLGAIGAPAVPMNRFRPNLVLSDIDAYSEDFSSSFDADGISLKVAKPCERCNVPNIDQATALVGSEPGDLLASYRANDKLSGAVTFGQNLIVRQGVGKTLEVGQTLRQSLDW